MTVKIRLELTAQEREIVALGASVGAGCHPCVRHHLDAGRRSGLDTNDLLAVVTLAESVASVAASRLAREARRALGFGEYATSPSALSPRGSELAALGAAVAANSMADIEEHLAAAGRQGLAHIELTQAVAVAQDVQTSAGQIHVRKTARLLGRELEAEARGTTGEVSGCAAADLEPAKAPSDLSARADADEGCGCGDVDDMPPDAASR